MHLQGINIFVPKDGINKAEYRNYNLNKDDFRKSLQIIITPTQMYLDFEMEMVFHSSNWFSMENIIKSGPLCTILISLPLEAVGAAIHSNCL